MSRQVKTYLYFIGKPRDPHANAIAEDFIGRAARFSPCAMQEVDPARFDPFEKHPSARAIFLDPAGRCLDTAGFVRLFEDAEMQGRDLVFALGGHDGLPRKWRERASMLLSLSAMTFPHELARAMLAEQIYRAFATLRNHPYPR
jgi:23S rRNA (pseudouridine1915-N3)-methyltransferase